MRIRLDSKIFKKKLFLYTTSIFWFVFGFSFAGLLLLCIALIYFEVTYEKKVYPGIYVDNIYVGEKTQEEIKNIFKSKNLNIQKNEFEFSFEDLKATVSAQTLNMGYNSNLLSDQVFSIGRSKNVFTNFYLITSSYLNSTYLTSSYSYDVELLSAILAPLKNKINKNPIDALFKVENNRVIAFKQSSDGRILDAQELENKIQKSIAQVLNSSDKELIKIEVPYKILKPQIATEHANDLGIVEPIGEGQSYFAHSIANRIHNITLAASRINGILIAPDEVFSFNKAIGDISKFTGYKEAYVIKNGKTVLGDGGGVCQVSSTLFRAVLNSGLPVIERQAHAYRVSYYEQDSPPGLDATIYLPAPDFKFRNDTKNHILIQSFIDPSQTQLIFTFYGKRDGRMVEITKPIITKFTPPPPPLYQDDPTLPKGTVKQIEHEAAGATVYFERKVTKEGKVHIDDKYLSRYTPWQAVFLQGTKEN